MANLPAHKPSRLFEWVDELPQPLGGKRFQRDQVESLYFAAAALPYRGEWDSELQTFVMDERFEGLTYGEVMVMRQIIAAGAGDLGAVEKVMDRLLGKPKQAVETKSMTMSYAEFLEASAAQEAAENGYVDVPAQTLDDILEGV